MNNTCIHSFQVSNFPCDKTNRGTPGTVPFSVALHVSMHDPQQWIQSWKSNNTSSDILQNVLDECNKQWGVDIKKSCIVICLKFQRFQSFKSQMAELKKCGLKWTILSLKSQYFHHPLPLLVRSHILTFSPCFKQPAATLLEANYPQQLFTLGTHFNNSVNILWVTLCTNFVGILTNLMIWVLTSRQEAICVGPAPFLRIEMSQQAFLVLNFCYYFVVYLFFSYQVLRILSGKNLSGDTELVFSRETTFSARFRMIQNFVKSFQTIVKRGKSRCSATDPVLTVTYYCRDSAHVPFLNLSRAREFTFPISTATLYNSFWFFWRILVVEPLFRVQSGPHGEFRGVKGMLWEHWMWSRR